MGSAWSFRRELLLSVTIPALWAEGIRLQAIAAPATASIAANRRDVFISDGEFDIRGRSKEHQQNESPHPCYRCGNKWRSYENAFLIMLIFALPRSLPTNNGLSVMRMPMVFRTDCTQLIVGIAPTWNSMRGELRLFERARGGDWSAVAGPFPVLFGKNGLAWGIGLAAQNEPGLRKKERDGRAPAGVFEIGQVFGYEARLPAGGDYPYHQVTEADIWSDDSRSPNYNRHIVIDPKNPPDNYTHEKMRSGDFAYHWLVEIRHNSDPPVPGAGSAIFFHIRRGVNRADHWMHHDGAGKSGEADHLASSETASLLRIIASQRIR